MNKLVYLIRHASAEDLGNSSMLKDIDRELISRGIMESARMGKYLAKVGVSFDKIVSSPANRALNTAKIIGEQVGIGSDDIEINENLYGGGPRGYLSTLNQLPESINSVAIVGHNPDISFFSEYLTRDDVGGSFEKATVLALSFECSWAEVSSKLGSFVERYTLESIKEVE